MIDSRNFCLKDIIQGGLPCKNPKIEWVIPNSDCLTSSCNGCTDECIDVTLLENCEDNCIKVVIDCEDCDTCPPEIYDVCFCNEDEDCDICDKCGPESVCISKCEKDEYCDENGTCGECSESKHCLGDKVCDNGKCVCPVGTIEDGIRCLDCDENSPAKNCEVCADGRWVPKDCGKGVCDPNTGECVGCFNSGDCGPDECCQPDNTCKCCDGFVYDYKLGCVPQGPCTTDVDCDDCFICTDDGCVPRKCPDGFICYQDKCVSLCNCDTGGCGGRGASCTEIYEGICACIMCEGDCENNNDCGSGCYCNDDKKCVKSPCGDTYCDDGLDCADGCGCDKDKRCVPCSSLNGATDECADTLGCEGQGGNCVDSDSKCNGNCTTHGDCGEGCGCYRGKCVSCDNFDCDDCDKANGCGCTDGVNCVDDKGDCNDTFKITKNDDNCEIEARLVTPNKCSCDRITISSEVKESTSEGVNFLVELRKGNADVDSLLSLPKLGDTGIANDLPLSGSVKVKVIEYGSTIGVPNGNVVISQVYSVSGTDTFETGYLKFNAPGSSIVNPINGANETVSRVEIIFEVSKKSLNFENSCSYSEEVTSISYKLTSTGKNGFDSYSDVTSGVGNYRKYKVLLSDTYRTPIFTWYKQPVGGTESVARKGYATRVADGVFVDGWLDHNDGIEIGNYYSVKSDCACDKTAYYTCPSTGAISTLRYCNPENLTNRLVYILSDCNKTITINGNSNNFNVCPSNSLGNQVYQLKLNDNVIAEFTAGNGKIKLEGTYTVSTPIRDINVHLRGSTCPDCYESLTIEDAVVEIVELGYDCDTQNLTYKLEGGSGNYAISVNGIPVQGVGNISLKKGDHEIAIKDNITGCEDSGSVSVDCCGDLYISPSNVLDCDGIDSKVFFDIVNGEPTYNWTIEKDDDKIAAGVSNDVGNQYEFDTPEEGIYVVKAIDDNGCEAFANFEVSNIASPSIGFGDLMYCQGATTKVVAFTLQGGSSYTYSITNAGNVVDNGVVSGSFSKELTIGSSKTFDIEVQTDLGCVVSENFTLVSKACPDPVVSVVTQSVCEGTPLVVTASITGGVPPYQWKIEESGSEIASGVGNIVGYDTGLTYSNNTGSVSFEVTATDANGKVDSNTGTVQVISNSDPNCLVCEDAPTVNINAFTGGNNVEVGQTVTLTPSDITMLSYTWMEGSTVVGTSQLFSPSTNNEGYHIYRLKYEYSAGCFEYTSDFKLTISEGVCDCDAAIKVTGGIPGLNGKTVTSVNKNQGEDVCVTPNNQIILEASTGSLCDEGDPNNPMVIEWFVMRYKGNNNVESFTQTGPTFSHYPLDTGTLIVTMTVTDGTCVTSAESFDIEVVNCASPDPFSITVFNSQDTCQSDANKVRVNFYVYASEFEGNYDTFPFTWKIVKVGGSSHTFKTGAVSGGWSAIGTQEFVEYIDLTPFIGQSSVEFKVEVKRTVSNVTKSDTDIVNILNDNSLYCNSCTDRNLTITIPEATSGVVNITGGDTATLTANVSSNLGSPVISNYKWKDGSTVIGSNKVLSVSPSQTKVYNVTITDDKGCTASRGVTVKVTPACRAVNQTLSWNMSDACPGDTIVLNWNVGDHVGDPAVIINGIQIPFTNSTGSHSMTMPQGGANATLRSYYNNSCDVTENSAVVELGVSCDCYLDEIIPSINGPKYVCRGESDLFTVNPNGDDTGYDYEWFDSGNFSLGTSDTLTYTQPTLGLTPYSSTPVRNEEYSEITLKINKAGCDERVEDKRVFAAEFGGIQDFNIPADGLNVYVEWCIGSSSNSSCYKESQIASIDLYEVTVDSYTPIQISGSNLFFTSIIPNTICNSVIRTKPFTIPGYTGSFTTIKVEVKVTTTSGYQYSRTATFTSN